MTTFDRYDHLPEPIRKAFAELEDFIGRLDGQTMCAEVEDGFIDEGTVDADDAVKALNAICASFPAQEWQDISTAPKGGVTVLGGWSASKTVSVVYQSDVEEHGFKWCLEDGAYVSTPTCWMPLPIVPDATLFAEERTAE